MIEKFNYNNHNNINKFTEKDTEGSKKQNVYLGSFTNIVSVIVLHVKWYGIYHKTSWTQFINLLSLLWDQISF